MKSRKIDWTDRDDVAAVVNFADFMFMLMGPKSAFDLASSAEEIIAEAFCSDCERHNEDCGCNNLPEYDDGASYED